MLAEAAARNDNDRGESFAAVVRSGGRFVPYTENGFQHAVK